MLEKVFNLRCSVVHVDRQRAVKVPSVIASDSEKGVTVDFRIDWEMWLVVFNGDGIVVFYSSTWAILSLVFFYIIPVS